MGKSIVNQSDAWLRAIGQNAECTRRLFDSGLDPADFQAVIDNWNFRKKLTDFWKRRGIREGSDWDEDDDALRLHQVAVLWARGFGRELGFELVEDYLKTVPLVPKFPADYRARFNRIILVDRRLVVTVQCRLIGVSLSGGIDDDSFVNFYVNRPGPARDVYWMACQDGSRYLGQSAQDCRLAFAADEIGLVDVEGLGLLAQDPKLLADLTVSLPGSVCHDRRQEAASLGDCYGTPLLSGYEDHYSPFNHGSASRGEFVG